MKSSSTSPARFRFAALDQIRGIAIVAMIFAHFGPGLYERLNVNGLPLDILHLFGRFATPAFVLIFGLTLAIVYVPRARLDPARMRRKLLNRAIMVFFCSLLICLPGTIMLIHESMEHPGSVTAFRFISSQYSVLTFYAVAMTITAFLLKFFAEDPAYRGAFLGSAFVFAGTYLAFDVWTSQDGTFEEIVRILFVSGKYGVVILLGSAWIMMSVGVYIHHCLTHNIPYRRNIFIIGAASLLIGLSDGRIVGWRDIADLGLEYHAPPHFWYCLVIGGISLGLLAVLDKFSVPVLGDVMAQVGRHPMSIYVAHAFVLPGIALLRYVFPAIPDIVSITLCLGLFLAFCAYMVAPPLIRDARNNAGIATSEASRIAG